MKNTKQKSWNRKKTCRHLSSLPFINIKDGENLLFLVDTDKCYLEDLCKFSEILGSAFPKNNIAFLPKDMALYPVSITGKEYTVINNVLKRMMEKTDEN